MGRSHTRPPLAWVFVLLALLCGPPFLPDPARAENWSQRFNLQEPGSYEANVNLLMGVKSLGEDEWAPADRHWELGVDADYAELDFPLSLAGALLYSRGTGSTDRADVRAETVELHLGVRKIWHPVHRFRPYLGGGLAVGWAEAERESRGITETDSDTKAGAWAGAGAYVTVLGGLNLGVDARWSTVGLRLLGADVDGGGIHATLVVGWHFQE